MLKGGFHGNDLLTSAPGPQAAIRAPVPLIE